MNIINDRGPPQNPIKGIRPFIFCLAKFTASNTYPNELSTSGFKSTPVPSISFGCFLRSESPTLLYLWEKSNEFDLLDTVLQKLGGDVALEDTVPSGGIPGSTKKKKRKSPSADTADELTKGLNASTRAFDRFNHTNLLRDKRDLQREIKEALDRVDELRGVDGKEGQQLARELKDVESLEEDLEEKVEVL